MQPAQPYVVNQGYVADPAVEVFVIDDAAKIWKKVSLFALITFLLTLIGTILLAIAAGLAKWSYWSTDVGNYIGMWLSRIEGVQTSTPTFNTDACKTIFVGAKVNSFIAPILIGLALIAACILVILCLTKKGAKLGRIAALVIAVLSLCAAITGIMAFSFYASWASSNSCGAYRHYGISFWFELVGALLSLLAVVPAFLVWKQWPIFVPSEEVITPQEYPMEFKGYPAAPTYQVADPSYGIAATYTVPSQGATFAPAGQPTYTM